MHSNDILNGRKKIILLEEVNNINVNITNTLNISLCLLKKFNILEYRISSMSILDRLQEIIDFANYTIKKNKKDLDEHLVKPIIFIMNLFEKNFHDWEACNYIFNFFKDKIKPFLLSKNNNDSVKTLSNLRHNLLFFLDMISQNWETIIKHELEEIMESTEKKDFIFLNQLINEIICFKIKMQNEIDVDSWLSSFHSLYINNKLHQKIELINFFFSKTYPKEFGGFIFITNKKHNISIYAKAFFKNDLEIMEYSKLKERESHLDWSKLHPTKNDDSLLIFFSKKSYFSSKHAFLKFEDYFSKLQVYSHLSKKRIWRENESYIFEKEGKYILSSENKESNFYFENYNFKKDELNYLFAKDNDIASFLLNIFIKLELTQNLQDEKNKFMNLWIIFEELSGIFEKDTVKENVKKAAEVIYKSSNFVKTTYVSDHFAYNNYFFKQLDTIHYTNTTDINNNIFLEWVTRLYFIRNKIAHATMAKNTLFISEIHNTNLSEMSYRLAIFIIKFIFFIERSNNLKTITTFDELILMIDWALKSNGIKEMKEYKQHFFRERQV